MTCHVVDGTGYYISIDPVLKESVRKVGYYHWFHQTLLYNLDFVFVIRWANLFLFLHFCKSDSRFTLKEFNYNAIFYYWSNTSEFYLKMGMKSIFEAKSTSSLLLGVNTAYVLLGTLKIAWQSIFHLGPFQAVCVENCCPITESYVPDWATYNRINLYAALIHYHDSVHHILPRLLTALTPVSLWGPWPVNLVPWRLVSLPWHSSISYILRKFWNIKISLAVLHVRSNR